MCVHKYLHYMYILYTYACKRPSGFHGILASHHEEFRPVSCPLSFTSTRKDNVSTGVSCGDAVAIFNFFGIQSILGYTLNYYPIGNGEYSKNVAIGLLDFFSPRGNDHQFGISGGSPRNSQRPISSHKTSMIFPAQSSAKLSLSGPRSWRVFTSYPLHEAVKQNNPHMVAPLRRLQYQLILLMASYSANQKGFHPTTPRQNFKLMKVCRSECFYGFGISENAANLTPDVGFGYWETMFFLFFPKFDLHLLWCCFHPPSTLGDAEELNIFEIALQH